MDNQNYGTFNQCPDCGYQFGDEFVAQAERSELKELRKKLTHTEEELVSSQSWEREACRALKEARDQRDSALAEVASLQKMAEVNKAFYNLTVKQRDLAWQEIELRRTAGLTL
jgi:hypothetical protein